MADDEKDVYEQHGLDPALSWMTDEASPEFSDVYNAFIENDYVGILTKEEAIECFKRQSGKAPELVTEWPVIDAIASEREALAKEFGLPEEYLNSHLPYEPALKHRY